MAATHRLSPFIQGVSLLIDPIDPHVFDEVRTLARALVDVYDLIDETAEREWHGQCARAEEGAPMTGKPACEALEPAFAMLDTVLAQSVDVVRLVSLRTAAARKGPQVQRCRQSANAVRDIVRQLNALFRAIAVHVTFDPALTPATRTRFVTLARRNRDMDLESAISAAGR